jgi:signal transduction histidine kinase
MRIALRVSALLIAAGAAVLVLSKPNGAHPNTWHFLHVTIALLFISALFAFALSRLENEAERARLLPYYLMGQWAAAFFFVGKFQVLIDYQIPIGPLAPFFTASLLLTFLRIMDRQPRGGAPIAELQAQYEKGIRLAAGQEERHRLARDLHDSIKQHVFAIQTSAATVQVAAPEASAALEQVRQSARDTMTELETMLDQLRAEALGVAGLTAALRKVCESTALRTGVPVNFTACELPREEQMQPGAADALLRIAQEALSNVARHARAKSVTVRLDAEGGLVVLRVIDDGTGFDAGGKSGGMGLGNIRARAAEFRGAAEIASQPGQGTSVRASLPLAVKRDSKAGVIPAALLLVVLALLWAIGPVGPNPLHPLLMASMAGALMIFLALRWQAAR